MTEARRGMPPKTLSRRGSKRFMRGDSEASLKQDDITASDRPSMPPRRVSRRGSRRFKPGENNAEKKGEESDESEYETLQEWKAAQDRKFASCGDLPEESSDESDDDDVISDSLRRARALARARARGESMPELGSNKL